MCQISSSWVKLYRFYKVGKVIFETDLVDINLDLDLDLDFLNGVSTYTVTGYVASESTYTVTGHVALETPLARYTVTASLPVGPSFMKDRKRKRE